MINLNTLEKRCLAALAAGFMLIGSSCASGETEEQKKHSSASTKTAEPSVGIGRDINNETERSPEKPNGYTICVDPGHGFVDGGAGEGIFEDGILEKDVNLAVAEKLVDELELLGFNTIMTHDGVNVPAADTDGNKIFNVKERSTYVNTLDVDYFVSIHVNSFDDTSVGGIQIYYEQNGNKVNEWSATVAQHIADSIEETFPDAESPALWDNKTLEVTRETTAAASLIEIGFCTNETDRTNMTDPEWQTEFAQAVAEGISEFFDDLK